MTEWIFAGIVLSAALVATFTQDMKRAILALWVAGLGVGAIYLTIEAEFLAIIQWIVSTLVTITSVFFAVMFGEYSSTFRNRTRQEHLLTLSAIVIGTGFSFVIWLGTQEFPLKSSLVQGYATDLKALGRLLVEKNFISLEVLALTLFLVLVGGGVVARSERNDSP